MPMTRNGSSASLPAPVSSVLLRRWFGLLTVTTGRKPIDGQGSSTQSRSSTNQSRSRGEPEMPFTTPPAFAAMPGLVARPGPASLLWGKGESVCLAFWFWTTPTGRVDPPRVTQDNLPRPYASPSGVERRKIARVGAPPAPCARPAVCVPGASAGKLARAGRARRGTERRGRRWLCTSETLRDPTMARAPRTVSRRPSVKATCSTASTASRMTRSARSRESAETDVQTPLI